MIHSYEGIDSSLFSCDICTEEYDTVTRIPKDIGCGHSFCLSCVKKLNVGNSFKCPVCKKNCSFPQGEATIPSNISLLKIIEARTSLKSDSCSNHAGYMKNLVCVEDKCTLCLQCILNGTHRNHQIVELKLVQEEAKARAQQFQTQLDAFANCNKEIDQLFEKQGTLMKAKIDKTFTKIINSIETQREKMIAEVTANLNKWKAEKFKEPGYAKKQNLVPGILKSIQTLNGHKMNEIFPIMSQSFNLLIQKADLDIVTTSFDTKLRQYNENIVTELTNYSELFRMMTSTARIGDLKIQNLKDVMPVLKENQSVQGQTAKIKIYVKTVEDKDKLVEIEIELDRQISEIREEIESLKVYGESLKMKSLKYQFKKLEENLTFKDYNIQTGSIIYFA